MLLKALQVISGEAIILVLSVYHYLLHMHATLYLVIVFSGKKEKAAII